MKNSFLVILIALLSVACGGKIDTNKYVVIENGDSIPASYLIGERHVGSIDRGATIKRLNKIYGENYVKQLRSPMQDAKRDSSTVAVFYIYDTDNHLLMVARADDAQSESNIKSFIFKSDRFTTSKGITVNSSVEELRQAYPDAVVVQYDTRFFVFIASLDLYLMVDESNIRGYDPEFVVDIPIDSLRADTHFENMSVSWDSTTTNILTSQFWHDLIAGILRWLIFTFPMILFIILIFIVAKRLLKFTFDKVLLVARRRVESDNSLDAEEAIKRVDTIVGILHGIVNILLWSIFILILLSKFNINIAPILASAGILGLAVGFGAQELVRDFICGFFILLEDQLRTGDMAIINNTTGVVEKIELRTVTLRDPSGVVHIFQNGKINSLSNMTKEWSAIVLEIGVAYKENIDRVMEIMKEVGAELKLGKVGHHMLGDIEIWGLDSFSDSAIVIKLVIKTRPMKQWRVKREYQRLLKIRFDSEGIEIPFPHVTLYTGENTKPMPIDIKK